MVNNKSEAINHQVTSIVSNVKQGEADLEKWSDEMKSSINASSNCLLDKAQVLICEQKQFNMSITQDFKSMNKSVNAEIESLQNIQDGVANEVQIYTWLLLCLIIVYASLSLSFSLYMHKYLLTRIYICIFFA